MEHASRIDSPDSAASVRTGIAEPAAGSAATAAAFRDHLLDALPADRLDLLRDFVRERVVRVLRLDSSEAPPRNARLMDLGFDSLMAVQLRNQLGMGIGAERPLPATLMFDYPTIDAIAEHLLGRIAPAAPRAGAASAAAAPAPALGRDAIANMSEAQIEALLNGPGKA
jgi:hypothetical protein